MNKLLLFVTQYSYPGIFLGLALGILGLPIPDETLLAFSGYLVSQGKLSYHWVIVIAFFGTSCGVTLGYFLGKNFGYGFLEKYATYLRINLEHLHKAEKWYQRFGKYALPIAYFIPGVRHFTAIFAGISQMSFAQFALFAYGGGFVWTLTFISLGYFLGEKWQTVLIYSHRFIIPIIVVAIGVLITAVIYINFRKKSQNTNAVS